MWTDTCGPRTKSIVCTDANNQSLIIAVFSLIDKFFVKRKLTTHVFETAERGRLFDARQQGRFKGI